VTGFVYRWTNNVNGKMYVGSHNGRNRSRYKGSGKLFSAAWKKYGPTAFTREILYEGPMFREVEWMILAAVDAKRNPHYYNLDNNPWGGGYERTPEIRKAQSERAQRKKRQRQIDLLLAGVVITPKMPRVPKSKPPPLTKEQYCALHKSVNTPEVRAKKSEAAKRNHARPEVQAKRQAGYQRNSLVRNHTRWHVNRGVIKPECSLCQMK